ncbi:cytochrome P450 [Astrocystis sublimbata]|nr:cytochrome P450 [Astrocystis sublimbata]
MVAFQLSGIIFVTIWLAWCIGLTVYRFLIHPLAHFPGPRLAAITGWVEIYYDVFKGGQFIFVLGEWHKKYGPIVRINPSEVHIADPDFVHVLLASSSTFDKKKEWKYRFGIPNSSFDTIEHSHHKIRRSAVSPFFSKQKISGIVDYFSDKVHKLCDRLEHEYKPSATPVTMNTCCTALSFDIITYYVFACSFDYIERPDFEGPFTNVAKELSTTLHAMGHFPWLATGLKSLPAWLTRMIIPAMDAISSWHEEIERQVRAIQSGVNDSHKDVSHKTVFNELLGSNLPPEEKTLERLRDEAASIVAGGVETTSAALSKAIFFILENPRVKDRLIGELESVFPDSRCTPPLAALEALPYLGSIINEVLRITIGISGRTVRKSRDKPVPYGGQLIPKGYYFSMTTYHTHTDPSIWDAPDEFRPERWLEADRQPRALNGQPLGKYMVGFGRGPRMCMGMNLARTELFLGLAILFRRCRLELFETTRDDVDMNADYVMPMASPTSKGVRVLVK